MDQHHSKLSPKFFFLSLGVLVTLIASVTSFLNLVFETLNQKFPDALNATYQYGYNTYNYEGIRTAIATLIIVFPVYLILSAYWRKSAGGTLGRVDLSIKKWMLYLILFLAGVVVMVDLITLVRYFVSGEITTRFIMKVVVALITALLVGWFYISELRSQASRGMARTFASLGLVIVIASVIWSFNVIGTPSEQRAWRLDEQRTQDLQTIQWQVISYWQQKEKLPNALEDLQNPISGFLMPVDPEFSKGNVYEYKKTGDISFELCATFTAVIPEGWVENTMGGAYPMFSGRDVATDMSYPYPRGTGNDSWAHEAGRTCFARTIDPDIYPPFNNPPKPL